VAFILVQQGVFGFYLGCSFAPNHKGMPVLAASDKTDFLRRQGQEPHLASSASSRESSTVAIRTEESLHP
jgi:hypothetical protein